MLYCPFRHFPQRVTPLGFVRLACLIHAANVRSEPGSNPSKNVRISPTRPRLRFELVGLVNEEAFEIALWLAQRTRGNDVSIAASKDESNQKGSIPSSRWLNLPTCQRTGEPRGFAYSLSEAKCWTHDCPKRFRQSNGDEGI